ncbi:MAG: FtsQ-type POTRA domain-containing protein [Acidimicrobiia bacterium]|nr:FtsQ-type POTRA domain-containing protein [Acidimicrobiia bacterium]
MSTPPTAPPRPPGTSPGAIDPRFRQRRIEVRRLEGRRRLRVLLLLGSLFAAALLAWGVGRSPLLDVDHVRITGTVRTTPTEVAAAAGIHSGMAMLDVDGAAASARLRAVPWILGARVERHWPATVTIAVVERVPVAAVPDQAGVAVVDGRGRVLAVQAAAPGLPMLVGLPPAGAPSTSLGGPAAELLAVAGAMPPAVAQRVTAVVAAGGGEVELRLRPAGIVRLGVPDQLAEKMVAARTVLTQVDLSRLAVLDVRVPASPAITRA